MGEIFLQIRYRPTRHVPAGSITDGTIAMIPILRKGVRPQKLPGTLPFLPGQQDQGECPARRRKTCHEYLVRPGIQARNNKP